MTTDTPPDRLAADPRSKFHDAAAFERGIGIRFNGEEKHNVEEYCVSEGWVRLPVGRSLDRRGNAMTMKFNGTVEPYFLDSQADSETDQHIGRLGPQLSPTSHPVDQDRSRARDVPPRRLAARTAR